MVERRQELDFRYTRKKKMKKLKAKLATPGSDREKILAKIKRLSPFWTEAGASPEANAPKPAGEAGSATAAAAPAEEPKKKAPPKPAPKKA